MLALLLAASLVFASRDPLPARAVEQPSALPKGWLALQLEASSRQVHGAWGPDGQRVAALDGLRRLRSLSGRARYGISRRSELWWRLPYGWVDAYNGVPIRDRGPLDVSFGWRNLLWRREAPSRDLFVDLVYQAANSADQLRGAPGVSLTSGTPGLTVAFGGRRRIGGLRLDGRLGYLRRFAGPVRYAQQAWIKPGDLGFVEAEALLQAGPLALAGGGTLTSRGPTRAGPRGVGLFPASSLIPVPSSEGGALDLQLRGLVHLSRGLELGLAYGSGVRGEDALAPVEALYPSRGRALSLSVIGRL